MRALVAHDSVAVRHQHQRAQRPAQRLAVRAWLRDGASSSTERKLWGELLGLCLMQLTLLLLLLLYNCCSVHHQHAHQSSSQTTRAAVCASWTCKNYSCCTVHHSGTVISVATWSSCMHQAAPPAAHLKQRCGTCSVVVIVETHGL